MKEIGGYLDLDLRVEQEFYSGKGVIRLNSGRCGIYHALRCYGVKKVCLPYYLCESVGDYLGEKGIKITYFHVGGGMLPEICNNDQDGAIVVVNYFGLIKEKDLQNFVKSNKNVIIDNTQGFYQRNIEGAISVYSPRKFFGVPDGAYVCGDGIEDNAEKYGQDISSDTSGYLLKRIELGSNNCYEEYLRNEKRIAKTDIKRMSKLTHTLLRNVNYSNIAEIRKKNYDYLAMRLSSVNSLNSGLLERQPEQVPMVYPLLLNDDGMRNKLLMNKVYISQWWKYLLNKDVVSDYEKRLSLSLYPLPIDQRYNISDMEYICGIVEK